MTSAPITNWNWIASSGDGSKLVALTFYGGLFTSPDSGTSWQASPLPYPNGTAAVALSADGTTLIAAVPGSRAPWTFYTSTNLGTSWLQTGALTNDLSSLASSADGTTLISAAFTGQIFVSKDSGATWTPTGAPAQLGYRLPVVCSADAGTIVAADDSGDVYTLQLPTPQTSPLPPQRLPILNVSSSGSAITLSWLVPSSTFVLQGNSDLATTNWTDLAVSPELNFTNLNYELNVPASSGKKFYRLRQQ
jgi:hypothetical protein